jgi:hypothetical protein
MGTPRFRIHANNEGIREVEFSGIASHKSFIGRSGSGQDRLGERLSITVVAFGNYNALREAGSPGILMLQTSSETVKLFQKWASELFLSLYF